MIPSSTNAPPIPQAAPIEDPEAFDRSTRVLLVMIILFLAGVDVFLLATIAPKFSRIFNEMLGTDTQLPTLTRALITGQAGFIVGTLAFATLAVAALTAARRRVPAVTTFLLTVIPLVSLLFLIVFALMRPMEQIIQHVQK